MFGFSNNANDSNAATRIKPFNAIRRCSFSLLILREVQQDQLTDLKIIQMGLKKTHNN